jgi:hypothetical protein
VRRTTARDSGEAVEKKRNGDNLDASTQADPLEAVAVP